MNNDELDREIEKEEQDLEDYIDKLNQSSDFKMIITDDYGYFEYPDDPEPQLTESGDLIDEDNLSEDFWMEVGDEEDDENMSEDL